MSLKGTQALKRGEREREREREERERERERDTHFRAINNIPINNRHSSRFFELKALLIT